MDSSSHQQNPCLLIADKQTQHQDHPLPLSPLATPTKSPSPAVPRNTSPPPEFPDSAGVRRRCKTRAPQTASPRNPRKSRRRSELEIREEKDSIFLEEVGKPRKRRQTARTKKEKPNSAPPSTPSPSMHFYHFLPNPYGFSMFDLNFFFLWVILCSESEEENGGDFDRVGQVVSDLIMWKNSSKSTFWFGFGSLCLVSSCFTQGLNFRSVLYAFFVFLFFTHVEENLLCFS